MEDRLLKFSRLVETGTFTKAAAALHISQPALTSAIHKLERELKTELLVRGQRQLTLTSAGRAAYQAATAIRGQADALKTTLAALAGEKPVLALGTIDSIAEVLFVHGKGFDLLDPQADLHISVNNSGYLLGALERDEIDCAFVVGPRSVPPSLMTLHLGDEPLVLVARTEDATGVQQLLKQGQLPGFLGYNQNSATAELIAGHLQATGITAETIFHSTSPEILLELVLSGRGYAVLPYLQVRELIQNNTLRVLHIGRSAVIERPILAVQRRGKRAPVALSLARKQVTTLLAELVSEARA